MKKEKKLTLDEFIKIENKKDKKILFIITLIYNILIIMIFIDGILELLNTDYFKIIILTIIIYYAFFIIFIFILIKYKKYNLENDKYDTLKAYDEYCKNYISLYNNKKEKILKIKKLEEKYLKKKLKG